MSFYPPEWRLPPGLQTAEFQLQPLTPAHVELDYDAVMTSRDMLNLWSGSTWPTPGFTLAENLKDLQWHDREHQERTAFTFTVLNNRGTFCLGCLYIRPLAELQPFNPQLAAAPHTAMARFWVRSSMIAGGLDRRLLQDLLPWLAGEWDFPQVYFHTRRANQQQTALFESSQLPYQFDLLLPRRGGSHQFWFVPENAKLPHKE